MGSRTNGEVDRGRISSLDWNTLRRLIPRSIVARKSSVEHLTEVSSRTGRKYVFFRLDLVVDGITDTALHFRDTTIIPNFAQSFHTTEVRSFSSRHDFSLITPTDPVSYGQSSPLRVCSTIRMNFISQSANSEDCRGINEIITNVGIHKIISPIGRLLRWSFTGDWIIVYVKLRVSESLIRESFHSYFALSRRLISVVITRRLQRLGVPSRFVYFPNENHWVSKPVNSLRWHEECVRFHLTVSLSLADIYSCQ